MFPMAAIHADEALRLANERLDGLRSESRQNRSATAAPWRAQHLGRVHGLLASIRQALGDVDATAPAPRLNDYPYRA